MHKKSGFTLIEILIGLVSAGIIGTILVGFLTQNSRIYTDQNTKINQGIELNNVNAQIEELIRGATGIVTQYPPTGQATYSTGLNTLVLTLPSLSAQGVIIQNKFDYAVLTRDTNNNKILRMRIYPDAASSRDGKNTVLSTKASKLEFRYLDASDQAISPVQAAKIGFIINVSDTVATESRVSSASGQINLRNN